MRAWSINPFPELVSLLRLVSRCSSTRLPRAFAHDEVSERGNEKCQACDTLPFLIVSCQLPKTEISNPPNPSSLLAQELGFDGFAGNSSNHLFGGLLLCNL